MAQASAVKDGRNKLMLRSIFNSVRNWASEALAPDKPDVTDGSQPVISKSSRLLFTALCLAVFLAALGVRLLHWSDTESDLRSGDLSVVNQGKRYVQEVRRMFDEGGILFPKSHDPGDVRMLLHPPGYAILMRSIYGSDLDGHTFGGLRLAQVIADALSAVLVVLIAAELLNVGVAVIAGLLVALSPHLSYYSVWLTPDSLAVLPLLIAVYCLIRTARRPKIFPVILAGAMIGVSCWLRWNALLLVVFFTPLMFLLFKRDKRFVYSAALVGTALLVISPIVIRNSIVFHRFAPLSPATGTNLIEGIAEFDDEGRFGMPSSDNGARKKDVEWHNRRDYAHNLWHPDGLDRDRARVKRGLAVIRSNPVWYLGVILRRIPLMLHYNGARSREGAFDAGPVLAVSRSAPFNHPIPLTDELEANWSGSPSELVANNADPAPHSSVSLPGDGKSLQITSDTPELTTLFNSSAIPVRESTDYVLAIPLKSESGFVTLSITGADRRVLTRPILPGEFGSLNDDSGPEPGSTDEPVEKMIQIPFASAGQTEVRMVVSGAAAPPEQLVVQLGTAKMFAVGSTPYGWTRYLRGNVRGIQRNVFSTVFMISLIAIGIALLSMVGDFRELLILLWIPIYYVCSHAPFRTHYRYTLPIHYFLFVIAAVAIYFAGLTLLRTASRLRREKGRAVVGSSPGLSGAAII